MITHRFFHPRLAALGTVVVFAVSGAFVTVANAQQCQPEWIPTLGGQPGVDLNVRAQAVFDDGQGHGDAIYLAGAFTSAGEIQANRIVKWSRAAGWSPLGSGVNDNVMALAVFDDGSGPALYAGGYFTMAGNVPANRIAKWDGNSWTALGTGITGGPSSVFVEALVVFDDGSGPALYAGGSFSAAGGVPANGIAKWNGVEWVSLPGGTSGAYAFAVFDDGSGGGPALFVGGGHVVKKWNGKTWATISESVNGHIRALTVFDDNLGGGPALYVGGPFTNIGNVQSNQVARWDGSSWTAISIPMEGQVESLTVFDERNGGGPALYAGGTLQIVYGEPVSRIAKWDGLAWQALDGGMTGSIPFVDSMSVFDDGSGNGPALIVGGAFTSAGITGSRNVTRWDGTEWSSFGSGVSDEVTALIAFDDPADSIDEPTMYAGGRFVQMQNDPVKRIAKLEGDKWTEVGGGVNGTIRALAALGNGKDAALFVGGSFNLAGTVPVSNIARWDGLSWSGLGTGTVGSIQCLAVLNESAAGPQMLIAGGNFISAGGVPVNNIARWDGSSWSPLGDGFNGPVLGLAVIDHGSPKGPILYACGQFQSSGGVAVNRIAQWDGLTWSPVGVGISAAIRAVAVLDEGAGEGPVLYASGVPGFADGNGTSGVARWDGTEWTPIGAVGTVTTLLGVAGTPNTGKQWSLYAGGNFTALGGVPTSRVAKWNGQSWTPLGDGMNGSVNALGLLGAPTEHHSTLFVGGSFTVSAPGDSFLARRRECAEVQRLPGDVNGDSLINNADLQIVLEAWGGCLQPCPADVDGNGIVDIDDLLAVIAGWS